MKIEILKEIKNTIKTINCTLYSYRNNKIQVDLVNEIKNTPLVIIIYILFFYICFCIGQDYLPRQLSSISTSFKIKMQLQYPTLKSRFKSSTFTNFPFFVDNFKSKIFVRWSCTETYDAKILRVCCF